MVNIGQLMTDTIKQCKKNIGDQKQKDLKRKRAKTLKKQKDLIEKNKKAGLWD